MSQPQTDDFDLLIATYYRPWSVFAFRWGVKLGPLTVQAYRGFNGWPHLEWAWMCGHARRIF